MTVNNIRELVKNLKFNLDLENKYIFNLWRELPNKIGKILHREAIGKDGFRIISKEDGKEITERLDDWVVGTILIAFGKLK